MWVIQPMHDPTYGNPVQLNKIQVFWCDGKLPIGITLASIHPVGKPGWFCVTPNKVAHGPYTAVAAFRIVGGWLHNFGRDLYFWTGH
jgi:hypothetical protein